LQGLTWSSTMAVSAVGGIVVIWLHSSVELW
jgi:hypothetical protein